jgi:hypothetical protein
MAGLAAEAGVRADAIVTAASLAPFSDVCLRNRTVIEELLGLPVRNDVSSNPVRQLNAFLKLAGLKVEEFKRRKKSKKSVREYGFVQAQFDEMASLARKFRSPDEIKADIEETRRDPGASTPIFDLKYPSTLLSPLPRPDTVEQ